MEQLDPLPVLDARELYDLVITCFPTRSRWKPEVAGIASTLLTVSADLTAAQLLLIGMCVGRTDVEAAIDRVIKDRT